MDIVRTRSGVIITYGTTDVQSFVKWALTCVAQWSFVRGRRQSISDDDGTRFWEAIVEGLEESMLEASVSEEKINLGIKSSVQMVEAGRNRSFHFWR